MTAMAEDLEVTGILYVVLKIDTIYLLQLLFVLIIPINFLNRFFDFTKSLHSIKTKLV